MLTSHVEFTAQLLSLLLMCLERQQKMAQLLESLPLIWETYMKFLALLASLWCKIGCCNHLESESQTELSLSLPPSLSLCLSNRFFKTRKKKEKENAYEGLRAALTPLPSSLRGHAQTDHLP